MAFTPSAKSRLPNIGECWAQRHATFLIMGETCTRGCAFCNVATGRPNRLDPLEPAKVARAVADLDLEHVVITSVDRDDLADGGARHFAATIQALRRMAPRTSIEILTPDFLRKPQALDILAERRPMSSTTIWKRCPGSTRRSGRVRATTSPFACSTI